MLRRRFLRAVTIFACSGIAAAQDGVLHIANLGRCPLESGKVIDDCRVGYRTFGALNGERTNAVLMPSWLYGTSADLAQYFRAKSTATRMVDTTRFFGVAFDSLGNGVSSSPSNSKAQHGPDFPAITERDMVAAEYRVATEVLHLKHAHAIIGLSMGGEQTFVWAVEHGDFFDLAVPIVATPRLTVYDLQGKRILLDAIRSDPGFHDGHYAAEPELKLANLINVQMVTTPAFRNAATSREQADTFFAQAEARLPADANDRVAQLQAVMSLDALHGRSIEDAARSVRPKFFVIVAAQDHMVTPTEALRWAKATGGPTYVSQGDCAHLIMACDAQAVSSRVDRFLKGEPLP